MAESSPPLPPTLHQRSGSTVRVPEPLHERVAISLELKAAVFAAYRAKDHSELRHCQLKESQYLLNCLIHDLEQPTASPPLLPPQLLPASPQLLRGLQADLARVNTELERDQLVPASSEAQGGEH